MLATIEGDATLTYATSNNLRKDTSKPDTLFKAIKWTETRKIGWDLESAQNLVVPDTTQARTFFNCMPVEVETRAEPMPQSMSPGQGAFWAAQLGRSVL